jgi:hypothetical protein
MFSQVLRGRVCYVCLCRFFQGRVGYVLLDLPAAFLYRMWEIESPDREHARWIG